VTSYLKKTVFCAILALTAAVLTVPVTAQTPTDVSPNISINSVGFLPDLQKRASVRMSGAMALPGMFTVNRVDNDATVFNGDLGSNVRNTDTGDTTRVADFTAFREPGRYYLQVPGVGRSANFSIGEDVFNDAYRTMMLGMYLWRCGMPDGVSATYNGKTYSHGACHRADANTRHIGGEQNDTRDGIGGWHDAGDFNKYTVNSGVTTGLLLKAWENHEETLSKIDLFPVNKNDAYAPGLPKFLAEIKWNLDWVAKMQYSDTDGRVSHKLSATGFCGYIKPENETATRFFVPWGSAATASFVAQMALGYRLYKEHIPETAESWLAKARVSFDFLMETPFTAPNQAGFSTGAYGASNTVRDRDNRLWAAAEMWEATGEAKYLQYFESLAAPDMYAHLGWQDVQVLGGITYLMSERTGRRQSLVDSLRTGLIGSANGIVTNTNSHGYGRPFGTGGYYWGSHGALTANTYTLNAAYKLTGEVRYRTAGHEILGHIFGRNYFNRSFVTGVGHNPPVDPHCRRSIADKDDAGAWPGYMIGGPHTGNMAETNGEPIAPQGATCDRNMPGRCYFDYYADYARNEIAINWNASMIYALSGFLDAASGTTSTAAKRVSPVQLQPKIKTSRVVQVRSGNAMNIPVGARVYTLNGRLIAHRKDGDPMPVIRRNGVFIMRVDEGIRK